MIAPLPIQLKYFGANATGRWSGDGGRNYQNLPAPHSLERLGLPDVRRCLVPPENHKFIIADFSQIEARLMLWQAGDTEQLKMIESGVSVYEAHARKTMNWKGGDLKKEDAALYSLAKARVLSCIEQGTPVLTEKGWSPIEDVTKDTRVWDGHTFVDHDGVVYQGDRETLHIHGIRATGDHKIYHSSQEYTEAKDADSAAYRFGVSSLPDAHALWGLVGHLATRLVREWVSIPGMLVSRLWSNLRSSVRQPDYGKNQTMPNLFYQHASPGGLGQTTGRGRQNSVQETPLNTLPVPAPSLTQL